MVYVYVDSRCCDFCSKHIPSAFYCDTDLDDDDLQVLASVMQAKKWTSLDVSGINRTHKLLRSLNTCFITRCTFIRLPSSHPVDP